MMWLSGFFIGISISSFLYYFKFKTLSEQAYIEYAERIAKWNELSKKINNIKPY